MSPRTIYVAAALAIAVGLPGAAVDWPAVIQGAVPAVVRLATDNGSGTGVVVSSDGYILTACHVVKDALQITADVAGHRYDARVVFSDDTADVALLRIQATNLAWLPLGDSERLQYEDEVRVLGFPVPSAGIGLIVVRGVFQGYRDRDGIILIQYDANTDAGHSGSPVVNSKGEVIGIHTERWEKHSVFRLGVASSTIRSVVPAGVFPLLPLPASPGGTGIAQLHQILVPGQFGSIQSALEAISEGGQVLIDAGEYPENLFVHRSVVLVGERQSAVRITGEVLLQGVKPALWVESASLVIVEVRNLTIDKADWGGENVLVAGEAKLHLKYATVSDEDNDGHGGSDGGTGIRLEGRAQLQAEECAISYGGDGGIKASGSSRVTLSRCTISDNEGGGLSLGDWASASLVDCEINRNEYQGLSVNGSGGVSLTDCSVSGNGDAGLSAFSGSGSISLENCSISGNAGEGLYIEDRRQVSLKGCHVAGNRDSGLFLRGESNASIDRCSFTGNSDGIEFSETAQARITNSSFTDNKWGISAGAYSTFRKVSGHVALCKSNVFAGNREGDFYPRNSDPVCK